MSATKPPVVSVPCEVQRVRTLRGKPIGYAATVRAGDSTIEGTGDTAASARASAGREVDRVLRNLGDADVLLGLDDGTVWVATVGLGGRWYYFILRPSLPEHAIAGVLARSGSSGSWSSKAEAVARMRRHWFQNYLEGLCDGLSALARGRWQIVCRECAGVSLVSPEPDGSLRCGNPQCGAVRRAA